MKQPSKHPWKEPLSSGITFTKKERLARIDAGLGGNERRLYKAQGKKRTVVSAKTRWRDSKVSAALAALPKPLKPPTKKSTQTP